MANSRYMPVKMVVSKAFGAQNGKSEFCSGFYIS